MPAKAPARPRPQPDATATRTPEQVADHFGVSTAVVIHWIRTRQLRATNVARSPNAKRPTWRVSAEAVAEFEAARAATAPAPRATRRKRAQAGVIEFYR